MKEKLYNYRADHTIKAMSSKDAKSGKSQQVKDCRHGLLGNSLDVTSLAVLLLPLLQEWGYIPASLTYDDVVNPKPQDLTDSVELRLVRAYMSYAGHKGGELRLESGPAACEARPALQSVDAEQWQWQTVLQATWQLDEHINTLEARSYVLMLKWRSRDASRHNHSFLHLKDSQVSIGAFLKHRSPSFVLNFLTQRAAALELACNFQPFMAFVRTHRNPADRHSRQVWRRPPLNPRAGAETEDEGQAA